MPKRPRSLKPVTHRSAKIHRKMKDRARGTAAERGYDSDWQKLREAMIRRQPVCVFHGKARGCDGLTKIIDHIQPLAQGGARLEPENLRGVCGTCHARLTGNLRASGSNEMPQRYLIPYTTPTCHLSIKNATANAGRKNIGRTAVTATKK